MILPQSGIPRSTSGSHTNCPLCDAAGQPYFTDTQRGAHYQHCAGCEFTWLDPAHYVSPEDERRHYEQHKNSPEDAGYRGFLKQIWEPLKATLPAHASGLDYGSGPGPTLHLMAQADGFACVHYDPVFHPDDSVFNCRYDFITCTETAEHFHHPAVEFARLAVLLRPGGWLALMTTRLTSKIDFATWHYRQDVTHVSFYSERSFQVIAQRFNFRPPRFLSNSIVLLQRPPQSALHNTSN